MYYRSIHFRKQATLIGLAFCLSAFAGLSAAPPEGARHAAADPAEVVPVEIRSVDLAEYPRVRVMFSAVSPYPRFVARDEFPFPGFRLSEAYENAEWPVFASRPGAGVAINGAGVRSGQGVPAGGQPPVFRVARTAADRLNLVLIVDSTKSMPEKAFRASLAAARAMVERLGPQDRMALYTLAAEPNLLSGFTGDQETLQGKLANIKREGEVTRVFDTLYSGLYTAQKALGSLDRSVAEFNQPPAGEARTMVLLLTDARDEDSFLNDEDCLKLSELGRRMSIPIYVGLYGRSKDSQSQPRLLKRLTLITGGSLMSEPRAAAADELLKEFRRLPRTYYEIAYDSPAALHGSVFPGATIRQRIALLSNGSEYANVFDYRVPFWSWVWMHLFTLYGLLFALVLLICILLLLLFWQSRRSHERTLARMRERDSRQYFQSGGGDMSDAERGSGEQSALPGDAIPPYQHQQDQNAAAYDEAPDIAPYLLAGHADAEPGTVVAHSEPAGVLMDDERTLYMREYTYRTTQMAVRQGMKYRRASMVLELRGGESSREYDLFLETTVVGSGRWANIPLRDETVSAVHAKIKRIDQRFIVYDLLSASGVYINGRKLLRPRALHDGDEVRIGRSRFSFRGVR
ncbi:MAG: FHA domain-containing protein [bacterium]|nr:FHA domain-containing protein [bacterium]